MCVCVATIYCCMYKTSQDWEIVSEFGSCEFILLLSIRI